MSVRPCILCEGDPVCGILRDGGGRALQVGAVDVLRFRGGRASKAACS
jgi:hypothetical protein